MNRLESIITSATIAQAREWQAASERFLFCLDHLGISAHSTGADHWVNRLEDAFEALLDPSKVKVVTTPRNYAFHALTVEFHDDAACPATVHVGSYSASFGCAIETGELECGAYPLSRRQIAFLETLADIEAEWCSHLRKNHPESS